MGPETPVSGRRAQTRRRLIEAAMDVFAERGFHAASVDDVARAAGYSIGALYSNFGGKEELLFAIFDEHLAWVESTVGGISPQADAAAWVDAVADWPRQFHVFIEFWSYAVRDAELRDRLGERLTEVRAIFERAITRAFEVRGREPALPVDQLAVVAVALVRGLAFERMTNPDAVPDELVGWLVEQLAA